MFRLRAAIFCRKFLAIHAFIHRISIPWSIDMPATGCVFEPQFMASSHPSIFHYHTMSEGEENRCFFASTPMVAPLGKTTDYIH